MSTQWKAYAPLNFKTALYVFKLTLSFFICHLLDLSQKKYIRFFNMENNIKKILHSFVAYCIVCNGHSLTFDFYITSCTQSFAATLWDWAKPPTKINPAPKALSELLLASTPICKLEISQQEAQRWTMRPTALLPTSICQPTRQSCARNSYGAAYTVLQPTTFQIF